MFIDKDNTVYIATRKYHLWTLIMSVIFPLIINMKDTRALLSDNDTEGEKNNLHRLLLIQLKHLLAVFRQMRICVAFVNG